MSESVVPASAAEVAAAWAEIADSFDPVAADATATALLREGTEHDGPIAAALEHMRLVDQSEGGTLVPMGYGFCYERQLWRRGIEAVLQARVLQQVLVWLRLRPEDAHALRNIVARHTFHTGLGFAAPRYVPYRGFKFIVVPYVFQELLLLCSGMLSQWSTSAGPETGWSTLLAQANARVMEAPPPQLFRKLVARLLTDAALDTQSTDENPISVLSGSTGWFSGIDDSSEPTDVELVLAYGALDFALSHEIGHSFPPGDGVTHLQSEQAADLAGLRLFAASWGWRDELLESCPLGEGARVLLGPIWFFYTSSLLFSVRRMLAQRVIADLRLEAGFLGDADEVSQIGVLAQRWQGAHGWLSGYVAEVKRLAGPISQTDEEALVYFVDHLESLSLCAERWVSELPLECLNHAVKLGLGATLLGSAEPHRPRE